MKMEIKVNDGIIFTELGGSYSTACIQKPDGMPKKWFLDHCEEMVLSQAIKMYSDTPEDWENIPADLYLDGKFAEHEDEAEQDWSGAEIDGDAFKKIENATKSYLQSYAAALDCSIQDVIDMGSAKCLEAMSKKNRELSEGQF